MNEVIRITLWLLVHVTLQLKILLKVYMLTISFIQWLLQTGALYNSCSEDFIGKCPSGNVQTFSKKFQPNLTFFYDHR